MKKIKLEDVKNSHGTTDWNALKKQNDADIEKAAKFSDAKLLSEVELAQFRRDKNELNSR